MASPSMKTSVDSEAVTQTPAYIEISSSSEEEGEDNSSLKRCSSSSAGPSNTQSVERLSEDITNGHEKIRISLVNETGVTEEIPRFRYLNISTVSEFAYVDLSTGMIEDEDCCPGCSGDCLSAKDPCQCAWDTRGAFAYTKAGLLTERFLDMSISMHDKPQDYYHHYCDDCPVERPKMDSNPKKCKGHLIREFIKECGTKCGCNHKQCGNRVVGREITRKLEVFLTKDGKGWGLRTLEELPKGAFVCEYVGEILTNKELYKRNSQLSDHRQPYSVLLDANWFEADLKDENALCLDATYYGNVARFINHRCVDCNLIDIPVQVDSLDRHYYRFAFFTKRKVKAMEELTWDYGINFDDHDHLIEAFQCICGSPFCRDKNKAKGTKRMKTMA